MAIFITVAKYVLSFFISLSIDILFFHVQFQPVIPITFNTRESHIKVSGSMSNVMNTSLDFRTFNEEGLLIHHIFSSKGFFAVSFF